MLFGLEMLLQKSCYKLFYDKKDNSYKASETNVSEALLFNIQKTFKFKIPLL